MTGLRFKVGELAIVALDEHGGPYTGCVVCIQAVGPFYCEDDDRHVDYILEDLPGCPLGLVPAAMDYELRKLDPPAEPASMTRSRACEELA